jgi:hypothetical protein
MLRLIRNFWEMATNVCRAKGNYGRPFKAGRGVTQGGPLSAKLSNLIVDAVILEWMRLMHETLDDSGGYLTDQIEAFFAIFYVDDGYIASLLRHSNTSASLPTRRRRRQWSARRGGSGSSFQRTHTDA